MQLNDIEKFRLEFLLKMYEQMFQNINRHFQISWQLIPVVGGFAIAVGASQSNQDWVPDPQYLAITMVFLSAWLMVNAIDANDWVTRNMWIIGNIEKQFLQLEDEVEIQHYFVGNRPLKHFVTHFIIQIGASALLAISTLLWLCIAHKDLETFWLCTVFGFFGICSIFVVWFFCHTRNKQGAFEAKSPGRVI